MQTILIVDDDEQLRAMLRLVLLDSGYTVLEAGTGEDVSTIYQLNHPDLVITDLFMPNKDGLEVILDIRRRDKGAKIIAMSGGGKADADSYLVLAQKFGAHRTLAKPFSPEALLEAVRLELES